MSLAPAMRVVAAILVLNLLVAAAKGIYGIWSGSLAVATDAIHSLLDAASNVVGLVALRLAASPPDPEHPYGHRKIEILAALAVGGLVAAGAVRFAWSAVEALIEGRPPPATPAIGFVVMGATLVVNVAVAVYEARKGRELGSAFLLADAGHTASDVLVTATVIASMVASRLGVTWADPVAALIVVVMIGRIAIRIVSANVGVLLDRVAIDPAEVAAIARSVPGVAGCHRIRSRGVEAATHLDMHLLVRATLTLRDAHAISHRVEDALRARFPTLVDVTIHVEPHDDPAESL
jgi:cation diffusion facilitator family transporter